MRTYPSQQIKKRVESSRNEPEPTTTEKVTKWLAIFVSGALTYYFLIKILFL